jgi:hypothetical protein
MYILSAFTDIFYGKEKKIACLRYHIMLIIYNVSCSREKYFFLSPRDGLY